MGICLVGQQGVLIEGFGAAAGLKQFFFSKTSDGFFTGGGACALVQVGNGFVDLSSGHENPRPPDQVVPDRVGVHGQQIQNLIVAAGLEQGAVAEGCAGEEREGAARAITQHVFQGRQELVGPVRGKLWRAAQRSPQ